MALKFSIDFENLSPIKRILLIIIPSLLLIAVFGFFFLKPQLEERSKLISEIEKQRNDIRLAQQQATRLTSLIAENERLKKRLSELQMQLPEEKEVSGLLKQVSELGLKSGLEVVLWKPQWNPKEKEKFVHPSKEVYEIPVDVEMRGNYHRFGYFFSTITRMGRIVNITNIGMKPADTKFQSKDKNVLNVNLMVKTFSLISDEDKKKLLEKEKEKEKEKKK